MRLKQVFTYAGLALASVAVAAGALRVLNGVTSRVEHNFAENSGSSDALRQLRKRSAGGAYPRHP